MLRFFGFFNRIFGTVGSWFQSPILLALRLFFGISLMYAGLSKLQDINKFTELLISLQVPYPEWGAWLAALSEFIGGIFLAVGFLSRIVSVPVIIVMGTAYATAHFEAIAQSPSAFVAQPPFNFLLTALLVWAFGPGFFSLDHFLFRSVGKAAAKPQDNNKESEKK